MSKSIIIIGAGIAGLSAGCYAQMNGYDTTIYELHDLPGGLCTSWKRKGYTFDGCIHWLVGSGKENSFYSIWDELGAIKDRQFINHEEFFRVERKNGEPFIFYTNLDRLEKHLKELSHDDSNLIEEFINSVRRLEGFNTMPMDKSTEIMGIFEKLKTGIAFLPYANVFRKYLKMSTKDFANKFKDPFLKECFANIFEIPDFPIIGLMMTLAFMSKKCAGFPVGGSLAFAQAIEHRYLELGGKIQYKSRVSQILVENNQAVGVQLENGEEHRADLVISAADGYATIFEMLNGKYINEEIRLRYKELPIFDPIIQVSLGVDRDMTSEPHKINYKLDEEILVAGKSRKVFGFTHYSFDPTLAPAGKSAMIVIFGSDYDYWQRIADKGEYEAEKQNIADQVIETLEKRFPGIKNQIEVIDVATPLTFKRYTGNYQGSMEGWLLTTRTMGKNFSKILPGLKNFYMIGQWVQPGGGVPPAAKCGRDVVQIICKKDKKKFIAIK